MADIFGLRKQYKHLFKQHLQELINATEFKSYWNSKFEAFHIVQLQKQHFIEAYNILCYQFSCSGGTNHSVTFMRSVIHPSVGFEIVLKHAIKTGLGFVVLDKHNHVIAIFFGNDESDIPPKRNKKTDIAKMSTKSRHVAEIFEVNYPKNAMYRKYILPKKGKAKFAEIFDYQVAAVKPGYENIKIASCCLPIIDAILFAMKYKYIYIDCAHPKTIYYRDTVLKNYGLQHMIHKPFDFSNYTFKDGTTIQKYYDDLKHVYGFTDEYVNHVKSKQNILKTYVIDLNQIDAHKPMHLWQMAMKRNKSAKL
eukprot:412672_1